MQVRDAERRDLPVVVEIYNELLHTTTSIYTDTAQTLEEREAWFDARTRRGFPTLVAAIGERVVGVAAFGDFRDSVRWSGYRFTVEHSVHVASDSWGSGVGRALMHALFERAGRMNVHAMIGAVDGANARSLEFHARLGFREVARLPEVGWKRGRWCDLVLVQRFVDRTA
ncbi:MAG TPA: GNAT family N-acetyltransferase [Polyangiaceae bacterium]|nr:GNAT family N-acetyltransferase [Polyangiaceae bacterium]